MEEPQTHKGIRYVTATIVAVLCVIAFFLLQKFHSNISLYMVVGLLLGFALERSRFCFVSAVSNFVLMKDGRLLRGVMVGLFIAVIGFAIMMHSLVPDPSTGLIPLNAQTEPLGLQTAIGGLLFGIGSVVSGGCVVGSLSRVGEGSLSVFILTLGILIGVALFKIQGNFWYDNYISYSNSIWLPNYLGWPGAIAANLGLIALVYLGIRFYEAGSFKKLKEKIKPNISFKNLTWKSLISHWPATSGGIAIGIISILAYWIVRRPIGVSADYERVSELMCNAIGIVYPAVSTVAENGIPVSITDVTWCLVLNFSIIAGALITSLYSGDFKIKYPQNFKAGLRVLLGAVVMGYGVGLAGGCNVGAFFSGVVSFGLNGWVFGGMVFVGSLFGIQILKKIS